MIKRVLTAGGLVVVGLLSYIYLFNVGPKDVVAYHDLATPVASEAFHAGDLVAISPDGQQIRGRVCSMDVVQGDIDSIPLSKEYSNSLRDSIPDFTRLVGWAKGLAGGEAIAAPDLSKPLHVSFVGHVSAVKDAGVNPPMSSDCVCNVAKALVRRENVCTVRRSLVETILVDPLSGEGDAQVRERTIGVTFRPSSIVIPDVSVLNCPGQTLNAEARAPAQAFDCASVGGHRPDVFLRYKLGVIRETDQASQAH